MKTSKEVGGGSECSGERAGKATCPHPLVIFSCLHFADTTHQKSSLLDFGNLQGTTLDVPHRSSCVHLGYHFIVEVVYGLGDLVSVESTKRGWEMIVVFETSLLKLKSICKCF